MKTITKQKRNIKSILLAQWKKNNPGKSMKTITKQKHSGMSLILSGFTREQVQRYNQSMAPNSNISAPFKVVEMLDPNSPTVELNQHSNMYYRVDVYKDLQSAQQELMIRKLSMEQEKLDWIWIEGTPTTK